MNSTQTDSISQLPLSWARTSTAGPVLNVVKLPFTAAAWIPTADIPHHYSFDQLYREYLSRLPNGFVLRYGRGGDPGFAVARQAFCA
jgi:hypothetical protein